MDRAGQGVLAQPGWTRLWHPRHDYSLPVARYDGLAGEYDDRYKRPVDQWEDEYLTGLLAPYVNQKDVLDLGCGTGWVIDHLEPKSYCGIDASPDMLLRLRAKHDAVVTEPRIIGRPGWTAGLPMVDTVVATWAADYFDLDEVFAEVVDLVRPGGAIALHGYHPRGRRRKHCIDHERSDRAAWEPVVVKMTAEEAGLPPNTAYGTGMLPDALARREWLWRLALHLPWQWHYGSLHVWRP